MFKTRYDTVKEPMLIDRLNAFLAEASQFPAVVWGQTYLMARRHFLADFLDIEQDVATQTVSAKRLADFISVLKKEEVDELALARGCVSMGEVFSKGVAETASIAEFVLLSQRFLKRVQAEERFASLRKKLTSSMEKKEQRAYDERLFKGEGLSYCLLYYLTYYKALSDAPDQASKEHYISAKEVNFGNGNLPGIRQDFLQDESLQKFILLILDEAVRTDLLWSYYECKRVVLSAKTAVEIECALHLFLRALLQQFCALGVTTASNQFFMPYGSGATIKKVLPIFEISYAPR